jgi:hypothetical protein
MGDDVSIVIPPTESIEEDTYERAGDELVALLTAQAERLGECLARIEELANRIIQLEQRELAPIEHSHPEFALTGHEHEYAPIEHEHEARTPEVREPDKAPQKQHPYFRKLSEL